MVEKGGYNEKLVDKMSDSVVRTIYKIKKKIYDFISRRLENIPENAIIDLHSMYIRR